MRVPLQIEKPRKLISVVARLGNTCIAAVEAFDTATATESVEAFDTATATESIEALNAAELKFQDIINSASVDVAGQKIDNLAEKSLLD